MKKKTVFFTHSAALSALFVLGNAVIGMPRKTADGYTFLGYIAVGLTSVLLILAVIPLANGIFAENTAQKAGGIKKALLAAAFAAVAVAALFCAADAFYDFCRFVSKVLLPDTSETVIFIVFAAVAVFFCTRRQEDILKLTMLSFWLCLVIVLFFFFAAFYNYNLRNIFIFSLPDFKTFTSQAKPYFINPLLPCLLLPVYQVLVFKKCRTGAVVSGTFTGFLMLGLCILSSLLLFGTALSGKLDYPYASAVSTVTVGRLFTRLDGFSYLIYFISSLSKITACIFIVRSCLKRLGATD